MQKRRLWPLVFLAIGCAKDPPQSSSDAGGLDVGGPPPLDGSAIGACPNVDESGLDASAPGPARDGGIAGGFPDPRPPRPSTLMTGMPTGPNGCFCPGGASTTPCSWDFLVTGGRNAGQVVDAAGAQPLGVPRLRHVPLRQRDAGRTSRHLSPIVRRAGRPGRASAICARVRRLDDRHDRHRQRTQRRADAPGRVLPFPVRHHRSRRRPARRTSSR